MPKSHTIKLNIKNDTTFPMLYHSYWFDSGRVANSFEFPKVIKKGDDHTVVCYERDWALSGCSGYVQYTIDGYIVTIAFSNPSVGTNKVGAGITENGKTIWGKIGSHDYQDFQVDMKLGMMPMIVHCKCSGGDTNDAKVVLDMPFCLRSDNNGVLSTANQAYLPSTNQVCQLPAKQVYPAHANQLVCAPPHVNQLACAPPHANQIACAPPLYHTSSLQYSPNGDNNENSEDNDDGDDGEYLEHSEDSEESEENDEEKTHTIELNIKNNTKSPMLYHSCWFDSGRVANNFEFSRIIKKGDDDTVVCYERDWALSGCSGYVQYTIDGHLVTIAFSNPSVGTNKVGVGITETGKTIWGKIGSHGYQPFQVDMKVGMMPVTVHCKCSGGDTNNAQVVFDMPFCLRQDNNSAICTANPAYPPSAKQVYSPQANQTYLPQDNQVYPPSGNEVASPPPSDYTAYPPSTNENYLQQANQVYPLSSNQAYPLSSNQAYPLSFNQAYPPQVNQVYPQQANKVYSHQVNQVYPPSANKAYSLHDSQSYPIHDNQAYQISVSNAYSLQANQVYLLQANQDNPSPANQPACLPATYCTASLQYTLKDTVKT